MNSRRFPFVGLVLAAMAGIGMEELVQWPSWSLLLGVVVALGGWLIFRSKRSLVFFSLITILFAALHAWQSSEAPARSLALLINNRNSTVFVKGVVASEVKSVGKNHLTFFIKAQEVESNFTILTPRVTMLVHWEGAMPSYGDLLSFRAIPETPALAKNPGDFDKASWLMRQAVYTELKMDPSEPGHILSSGHGLFLKRWAIAWRERSEKLLEYGIEGAPEVVNILKGIVLGIKENRTSFEDFQLTGTMHLFAVSGLHVGMVVMIFWFLLSLLRLPFRAAVPITLLLLFCYVMTTGFHIGSLRAGLMAAIVLIGFLLERRPQVLNNLAAAAFLLLAFDTNLLFSMGWQFSFSVVLAIVLLTPLLEGHSKKYFELDPFLPKSLIKPWQKRWQHTVKHVTQLVAVSIASWIGALLPTACYFHQISFSALGANIIAVPLAFLIMLTALLAISTGLIVPGGAAIFNNANWLFVKLLIVVVHGFALLPWSSCSIALPIFAHSQLVVFDCPDAQAMILQSEGKTWAINTGHAMQATKTIVPFLEQAGVTHLEGLILTQTNASSAGGASLLLEKEKPRFILVPSNAGHALQFRHFLTLSQTLHHEMQPIPKNLNFSTECWGEFIAPGDIAPFAFKLHWPQGSFLSIPNSSLIEWFMNTASSEFLSTNILHFSWRPMNLLQYESFLAKVKPKVLILPETFSRQGAISQAEKEMLKRYNIMLLAQEQTGAVNIRVPSNGRNLEATGWQEHLSEASSRCK